MLLAAAETVRAVAHIAGTAEDTASRARWSARLRAALGDEAFDASWAAGGALTTDAAIVFALAEAGALAT